MTIPKTPKHPKGFLLNNTPNDDVEVSKLLLEAWSEAGEKFGLKVERYEDAYDHYGNSLDYYHAIVIIGTVDVDLSEFHITANKHPSMIKADLILRDRISNYRT